MNSTTPTSRMKNFQAAVLAGIRSSTAATPRGTRKMLLLALPKSPLKKKLEACRSRKGASQSRYLCGHAACPLCMHTKAKANFQKVLWPMLEGAPPDRMRWVTVITNIAADLDIGALEATRQHRRLQHALKRAAKNPKASDPDAMHVWGCREVERDGGQWVFHVHMLVDLFTVTAVELGAALREAWPAPRAVMVKRLTDKTYKRNIHRLARYMMKARYTVAVGGNCRVWMDMADIAAVAEWRDRMPLQWHRWTWGVRRSQDVGRFFRIV